MLRMIDRHAVQALLHLGMPTEQVVRQIGVTRRTVQRIAEEPPVSARRGRRSTAGSGESVCDRTLDLMIIP